MAYNALDKKGIEINIFFFFFLFIKKKKKKCAMGIHKFFSGVLLMCAQNVYFCGEIRIKYQQFWLI